MIEFKYNDKGILEFWRDGKKVDEIITMSDVIKKDDSDKSTEERKKKGNNVR